MSTAEAARRCSTGKTKAGWYAIPTREYVPTRLRTHRSISAPDHRDRGPLAPENISAAFGAARQPGYSRGFQRGTQRINLDIDVVARNLQQRR
jgi:hypothetical protein